MQEVFRVKEQGNQTDFEMKQILLLLRLKA